MLGDFLGSVLTTSTPLILATLAATLCNRAGFFNIAIEGQILVGAFGAAAVAKSTGLVWLALLVGCVLSALVGSIVAIATYLLGVDVIVAGVATNLLTLGITAIVTRQMTGGGAAFMVPPEGRIPHVGRDVFGRVPILEGMLGGQTLVVFGAIVLVVICILGLANTRTGLAITALGQSEQALRSSGNSPARIRTILVVVSGLLTGLAGAQLSLGPAGGFAIGMSDGRGFTALIAAMIGPAVIAGTLGALLFGLAETVGLQLQLIGVQIPASVIQMVPYLLSLIVLVIASGVAHRTVDRVRRRILLH